MQTLRGPKAMRELVHVVVSEVRERGQGGKEQRDVVVVVLDDYVGKAIDKQELPMREGLLLLSEIAMDVARTNA